MLSKVNGFLKWVYGYGLVVSLFLGGLTFPVYLLAMLLGGQTATAICTFVYKQFFPIMIFASSCLVLVGLLTMYLAGEVALSLKNTRVKPKDTPK